jgi:DNA-binding CsgD family transcriptional regulator
MKPRERIVKGDGTSRGRTPRRPYPPRDAACVFDVQIGGETVVVLSLPVGGSPSLTALTDAEREVAHGVLRGLSNSAVADLRGCAPRTIANQLASIYRKLGITSRSELAALMSATVLGAE